MADAEKTLHEVVDKIANELKYDNYKTDIKPITIECANFSSVLFSIKISAPNKEDINAFAKVVVLGEKLRGQCPLDDVFTRESFFYTDLLNEYRNLEDKCNISPEHRLNIAKYYGHSNVYLKETLVLEDLTKRGFSLQDRREPYDWEYAAAAVKQLAILHALSIAYGEDNPEEFKELLEKYKFSMKMDGEMQAFFESIMQSIFESIKPENRERLQKIITEQFNFEKMAEAYKPKRRPVLAHGDYRPSNMMHKLNENGKYELIPVDFQTIQSGCPISDLMYFIYSGSDGAFRRRYYKDLLELYYKELKDALVRLQLDPEKIYSKDDYEYELEETKYFGLFLSIFVMRLVTANAEDAPKVDENMDLNSFNMKKSSLYEQRLNEVVDEFIERGLM